MAFCAKCGKQMPDGTGFCPSCGAPIGGSAPQQAAPIPQPVAAYDPYDHTAEFDPRDISDNKVMAMACYLLGVLGIVIALLASRESKYAYFHVRQAMKIQLAMVLIMFFNIIPFLGWAACGVCAIILTVVEIIGFFSVAGGKAKDLPIVRGLGFFK